MPEAPIRIEFGPQGATNVDGIQVSPVHPSDPMPPPPLPHNERLPFGVQIQKGGDVAPTEILNLEMPITSSKIVPVPTLTKDTY
jgi:hypothetical protein